MSPSALEPQDDQSQAKEFFIFGNGISFSVSPTIHNAGFRSHDLPHTYAIRESENMDGVAQLIQADSFGGASVTMPHKLQASKYCHRQTETAEAIGAINTLVVDREGDGQVIVGDNTDWSGLASLIEGYKSSTRNQLSTGLVIGAGGASRAALYALHRSGVKNIYVHNRTVSKAEAVKEAFAPLFSVTVLESLQELPSKADIIIGTVPADTTTESQFAGLFADSGLCVEMSYKPRITPLLLAAQKYKDWQTVTGIEVLLAQAFDQYRLWTGKEAPREAMIRAVEAHEAKLSKLS